MFLQKPFMILCFMYKIHSFKNIKHDKIIYTIYHSNSHLDGTERGTKVREREREKETYYIHANDKRI